MDLMGNTAGYAKTAKKGLPKWGFLEEFPYVCAADFA